MSEMSSKEEIEDWENKFKDYWEAPFKAHKKGGIPKESSELSRYFAENAFYWQQEKIEVLTKALEFYADERSWNMSHYESDWNWFQEIDDIDLYKHEGSIYIGGKTAREALEKVKEIKGGLSNE